MVPRQVAAAVTYPVGRRADASRLPPPGRAHAPRRRRAPSRARPSLEGGPDHMSSIETNMQDAPQVTYEEAMVGRVIPVVRVGPAIVEERGPVGLGWLRDLPDF